jgi:serine/threonine-protein kinase
MLVEAIRVGDQLDHYRIDRVVANTNTDTIFHGTDLRNNTPVAIKMPYPELESDPAFADRFRREEEIGERLNHPGVIRVIPEHHRSRPYLVLEWFEGRSLRELLSHGKLAPERATKITIDVCKALAYIHDHGIAHRDLRPEHILIDSSDGVKLIHFGRAAEAAAPRITFTNISQVIGAADYIAPEELKGKRGDARSDLYATGMILYEMLTGRKPFPEPDLFSRVSKHPVPPREIEPTISPQLQEVIYRALERNPTNRYPNAHGFQRDLEHLDDVGVADRAELRDWKKGRSRLSTKVVLYFVMAMIPIVILGAMLYFAKR